MCTDGAPSIKGKEKGLVGLMKKSADIPNIVDFHCIIHQEALVAKLRNHELQNVMQLVARLLNFIVSRPLNHRQFRGLLESTVDYEVSSVI